MLPFSRELFETRVRLIGPNDAETIQAGANLLVSLIDNKQFKEAEAFARKHIPLALAKFGPNHQITRPSSWREFRRREFPKTTIAEALNLLLPARTKPKNPSYPLQPRSNPPRGTGTAQKSKAASTLSEPNAALAWSSRCRADKVPGGAAAWAVRG